MLHISFLWALGEDRKQFQFQKQIHLKSVMEQDEQGGCLNCKEGADLGDCLRKIKHSRWLGSDIFGGAMAPSPGATLVSFVGMHTFVFWPHRHRGIEQDPREKTVIANSQQWTFALLLTILE